VADGGARTGLRNKQRKRINKLSSRGNKQDKPLLRWRHQNWIEERKKKNQQAQ